MYGINTPNAMRMLAMLHQANQAPPEPPAPIRKTVSRPKTEAVRQRRPPTPQSESESESDSLSDSGSSASSGSSYEDVETIYRHVVEDKKCAYVSPAGLKDKKTSKEAIAHLKVKNCPEVPALKKRKEAAPKVASPKAPTMAEAAAVRAPKLKKTKKVTVAEPAPVAAVAAAAPAEAPSAPAATSTEKKKRAPSAYNTFVAEQRKAGKSMAEAAAAWKAKKGS